MKTAALYLLLFTFALALRPTAHAEDQDIMDASMLDLANLKSTLAKKRETPVRESPDIITVVTRDQIVNSGVRDLKEILTLFVPGISFGMDVEGNEGIAVRGLWGHEGKVLLMMDGVPLNDEVYSNSVYGNHYPSEMIEKVEVLRGPGSVINGDYALIGVINITSRKPTNGGFVDYRDSEMSDVFSHRNLTAGVGNSEGKLKYNALISGGEGVRTQNNYVDVNGESIGMKDQAALNPKIFNGGIEYDGFSVRMIWDRYDTTHFQVQPNIPSDQVKYLETFESRNIVGQYKGKVSDSLEINPYVEFRQTSPWDVNSASRGNTADDWQFTKMSRRMAYGVSDDWTATDNFSLLSGIEYSTLRIRSDKGDPFNTFMNGLNHEFWVFYAEGTYKTKAADFAVGARYEDPLDFRPAFVPRIGVSKAFENWHYKAMWAQSYRTPEGIHLDLPVPGGPEVKPEIATNIELEVGRRIVPNFYLTASVFDIKINDPIIYSADPSLPPSGAYFNGGAFGTRGVELETRYAVSYYDFSANASYYHRAHDIGNSNGVPGEPQAYVAMPNYRVSAVPGFKITKQFGFYPSATWQSERWGYVADGVGGTMLQRQAPTFDVGFNLRYTDLFFKGLELSAGMMNMTDVSLINYEAYNGGRPATPGLSRAYNFMLGYNFNL